MYFEITSSVRLTTPYPNPPSNFIPLVVGDTVQHRLPADVRPFSGARCVQMKQFLSALVFLAGCSSSNHGHSDGFSISTADGGILFDLAGVDSFYLTDPPAMTCGLDGGVLPPPPQPGGTADCPDDKNRENCPCPQEGMMASCWPGLRANRNLGICKDGTTVCQRIGELTFGWGPCMGYVLPVAGATQGADACKCFSHGKWAVDNVTPCFIGEQGQPAGSGGAISTVQSGNMYDCPTDATMAPTLPWSIDTITADCEGHFKLCYTLKAGSGMSPQSSDCVVQSVCTEGNYTTVNQAQSFPPLGGWIATSNTTCTKQFATTGGYGEMSVDGFTVSCDTVSSVFNRVSYCPTTCMPGSTDPNCTNCSNGGSGTF